MTDPIFHADTQTLTFVPAVDRSARVLICPDCREELMLVSDTNSIPAAEICLMVSIVAVSVLVVGTVLAGLPKGSGIATALDVVLMAVLHFVDRRRRAEVMVPKAFAALDAHRCTPTPCP